MTVKTAGKIKKSLLTRRNNWISLLNSAEICKKNAVTQVNFHLYHQGNISRGSSKYNSALYGGELIQSRVYNVILQMEFL